MASIMPFQRTSRLINDVDEFLDRVQEAVMVLEKTVLYYLERNGDEQLQERFDQIAGIEKRADELRRSVANVMYSEMLMPETRGDVLNLLDAVDDVLDECVHLVATLLMERPDIPDTYDPGGIAVINESTKAMLTMLSAARTYFKDPLAVRGEVQKIHFHAAEATATAIKTGREIFDSDLPLVEKRHLSDWVMAFRFLGSRAGDVGDMLAIFAVKRSA